MLPYRESRLAKFALVVFFILLIGYAYYEARSVLFGPQIQILTNAVTVHDQYTEIRGQATFISELTINGMLAPVTEDGKFAVPLLLSEGENRVMLDARDKFGRTTQEVLTIYYTPNNKTPTPSSTATTTL